jgi:hypothetical protein
MHTFTHNTIPFLAIVFVFIVSLSLYFSYVVKGNTRSVFKWGASKRQPQSHPKVKYDAPPGTLRAEEMRMTPEQRVAVMTMVRDNSMTVDEVRRRCSLCSRAYLLFVICSILNSSLKCRLMTLRAFHGYTRLPSLTHLSRPRIASRSHLSHTSHALALRAHFSLPDISHTPLTHSYRITRTLITPSLLSHTLVPHAFASHAHHLTSHHRLWSL